MRNVLQLLTYISEHSSVHTQGCNKLTLFSFQTVEISIPHSGWRYLRCHLRLRCHFPPTTVWSAHAMKANFLPYNPSCSGPSAHTSCTPHNCSWNPNSVRWCLLAKRFTILSKPDFMALILTKQTILGGHLRELEGTHQQVLPSTRFHLFWELLRVPFKNPSSYIFSTAGALSGLGFSAGSIQSSPSVQSIHL